MTWLEHHRMSEEFASSAEVAVRRGELARALGLYAKAAQAGELALKEVEPAKSRTYGITAVSAVALHFKAAQWEKARCLAHRCLGSGRLPDFAAQQMNELLDSIKAREMMLRNETRPNGRNRGQYHSALHDSDNVYHVDSDCSLARNIKNRCSCTGRAPRIPCPKCA